MDRVARATHREHLPITLDDERQLEGSEPVFRGMARALSPRSFLEPERRLPFGLLGGANERLSPQSTEALGLGSSNDTDGTAVIVRLTSMLGLFPSTTRWGSASEFARS